MPRIWLDYARWMEDQKLVTRTRRIFDRALRALPITQHRRVWPLYLTFISNYDIPETAVRVYRRYLKLCPGDAEQFIDYLIDVGRLDTAAVLMAKCVNNDKFSSKHGKTNHQLWTELCELISKNPQKVTSLRVEPIIRQGLRRFTDQTGKLWCALADYFIRAGHFDKATDIYEEAVQTVTRARDFATIFDAYNQFSEQLVNSGLSELESDPTPDLEITVDLRIARLENLLDRRPLLLNSVMLRQNPHNVHEWLKRVKLYENQPEKIIDTFTEAVKTVDPKLQTGRLSNIWITFAKFYEDNDQLDDARPVFEKALLVPFAKVDELAAVWCAYAEMEVRHDNYRQAVKLLKRAVTPLLKKAHYFDEEESVQARLHKSLKVWSMLADLEESFGTFQSCKMVYDRIIDTRIATPQIIINYGLFLEENDHFEEAFKAYEKGIALFRWPNVFDIWNTYFTKFIKRFSAKKFAGQQLERARDLFSQCLDGCPPKYAKNFYLLWAKMEEDYGQPRRAMEVYAKTVERIPKEEMYEVFNIYLKKAAELYGVTHTRAIYEKAIEILPEDTARQMCIRFADLERKLGEIDRARAIYTHCSELCDPRIHPDFWSVWKEFEIKHGNEDTVREMLRIKRSVQATYNTKVNYMSAQMLAAAGGPEKSEGELAAGDSMAMLEAKAQQIAEEAKRDQAQAPKGGSILFVSGGTAAAPPSEGQPGKELVKIQNPAEIDLGDDDDDDDEDEPAEEEENQDEVMDVERRAIPSEVFGGLATDDD